MAVAAGWWRRIFNRHRCRRGHTWAPWIKDPHTHLATRHCLFCAATWIERLAE